MTIDEKLAETKVENDPMEILFFIETDYEKGPQDPEHKDYKKPYYRNTRLFHTRQFLNDFLKENYDGKIMANLRSYSVDSQHETILNDVIGDAIRSGQKNETDPTIPRRRLLTIDFYTLDKKGHRVEVPVSKHLDDYKEIFSFMRDKQYMRTLKPGEFKYIRDYVYQHK